MTNVNPCLGGCDLMAKRFGLSTEDCCGSCHNDDAEGYSDLGDWQSSDGWYMCCCGMRASARLAGLAEQDAPKTPKDAM